ncbi:MAG TPA: hypothetical protein VKN73_11610, partial [Desulfosalsimonadaceae bacterium]|nr:hypothetical protein [Desulfosalsimonadaceae bacterium]
DGEMLIAHVGHTFPAKGVDHVLLSHLFHIVCCSLSSFDGFAKSPISLLRCIPRDLRAAILNILLCHLKIDFLRDCHLFN